MSSHVKIKRLLKQSDADRNNGLLGEEEACLQNALALDGKNLDAMLKLANLRFARGQTKHALALYQYVAKRLPPQSENGLAAWMGWIRSAHYCGLADESERIVNRLVHLVADASVVLKEYVSLVFSDEQYERALHHLNGLVSTLPENTDVCMTMAKTLHCLRRLDEAESWYQRALALMEQSGDGQEDDERYEQYRWEYAMQLLLSGRLEEGWKFYESRLKAMKSVKDGLHIFPFDYPRWQGQNLSDKTLLVHGEQGIGDEIMFMSLANELIDRCAHLVIACTPSLAEIFQRSFPRASVVSHNRSKQAVLSWESGESPEWLSEFPRIDFHCPMGSIAFGLRARENEKPFSVPAAPYLLCDEQKCIAYQEKMDHSGGKGKLKIGLMWDANLNTGSMGRSKSIPLKALGGLAHDAVQFVSLQNYEYGRDFASVPTLNIIDFSDQLIDFDQTAALVSACDLVITVDTSVAHLAAAMGKPTWILLKFGADWRYMIEKTDCIWYPSAKLFRQSSVGDWDGVVQSVDMAFVPWREKSCS